MSTSPRYAKCVSRSRAFTLMEILVVVGIIALLLGILIPVVSQARKQANTMKCMSNQKQLIMAVLNFAHDHNDTLPTSGYSDPHTQLWAYDFTQGIMGGKQVEVEGGQLWKYVHNYGVYHCPQAMGPWPPPSVQNLTNYSMNGSMSGWGPTPLDLKLFKSDDVVFWEVPSSLNGANGANDATNDPKESVTARHKHGTTLSHIDGHVDVVSAIEYIALFQYGPSILWADPTRADGGLSKYAPIPTTIMIQEE